MFPITKLSQVDVVFPANVRHLMPEYSAIERTPQIRKLENVAQDLFFNGGSTEKWQPKEGVDKTAALRQIRAILGSFEPKHEHKIAGVAFLLNEWFTGVE